MIKFRIDLIFYLNKLRKRRTHDKKMKKGRKKEKSIDALKIILEIYPLSVRDILTCMQTCKDLRNVHTWNYSVKSALKRKTDEPRYVRKEEDKKKAPRNNSNSVYFQLHYCVYNWKNEYFIMKGNESNGKSISLVVSGFQSYFYLQRQTPFVNDLDAAEFIVTVNRWFDDCVYNGRGLTINHHSKKDRKSFNLYSAQKKKTNSRGSWINKWSIVNNRKSMFGYSPEDYRDNVLLIYVPFAFLTRDFHNFFESEEYVRFCKGKYVEEQKEDPDWVFKYKMVRTFEANMNPEDKFMLDYNINYCGWCFVDGMCGIDQNSPIIADRYFRSHCKRVYCDSMNLENAPLKILSYDIECVGKEIGGGKTRFPIPMWTTDRLCEYGRKLGLTDGVFKKNRRSTKSPLETLSNLKSVLYGKSEKFLEDLCYFSNLNCADFVASYSDGDAIENIKKRKRETSSSNNTNNPWRGRINVKNKIRAINKIVPNLKDTDPVVILSFVIRINGKNKGLEYDQKVILAYENGMAESTKRTKESDDASDIWKYHEIQLFKFNTEAKMIYYFCQNIKSIKPDALTGWYTKQFDLAYLWLRKEWLLLYGTEDDKRLMNDVDFGLGAKGSYDYKSRSKVVIKNSKQGGERVNYNFVTTPFIISIDGYDIFKHDTHMKRGESLKLNTTSMSYLEYPLKDVKRAVNEVKIRLKEETFVKKLCTDVKDCLPEGYLKNEKHIKRFERLLYTFDVNLSMNHDPSTLPMKLDEEKEKKEIHETEIEHGRKRLKTNVEKKDYENYEKFCKEYCGEGGVESALDIENFPMRKIEFDLNSGTGTWKKGGEGFWIFCKYCYIDSCLPPLILEKAGKMGLLFSLSRTCNISLDSVYSTGVQRRVLSFIRKIVKKVKNGLYLIPDYGFSHFHWPGIFWNRGNIGCKKALKTSERLMPIFQKSEVDVIKREFNEKEEDYKKNNFGCTNSKLIERRKEIEEMIKLSKLKRFGGGRVIPPKKIGVINNYLTIHDFQSLYPMKILTLKLCYTTFVNSHIIHRFGLKRWQYMMIVLGPEDEIVCGELYVNEKLAKKCGYVGVSRLKVAYWVPCDDNVLGLYVDEMFEKRLASKADKKEAIKAFVAASKLTLEQMADENFVLSNVSEEYTTIWKNTPVSERKGFSDLCINMKNIYDDKQQAEKLCLNGMYGFTGAESGLPVPEIAASTTSEGRKKSREAEYMCSRTSSSIIKRYETWCKTRPATVGRCPVSCDVYENMNPVTACKDLTLSERIMRRRNCSWLLDDGNKDLVTCDDFVQIFSDEKHDKRIPFRIINSNRSSDSSNNGEVNDNECSSSSSSSRKPNFPFIPYGDTDSIFAVHDDNVTRLEDAMKCDRFFCDNFNGYMLGSTRSKHGGMKLVPENTFKGYIQMKKKGYVGFKRWDQDFKFTWGLKKTGIDTERGDALPFVVRVLGENMPRFMADLNVGVPEKDAADEMTKNIKNEMKKYVNGEIPLSELVVQKKIKKAVYAGIGDHLTVRDKKVSRGETVVVGDVMRIVYLVLPPGSDNKASSKAEDYDYAVTNDLEIDYYFTLTNKIMKPICRNLAPILLDFSDCPYIDDDALTKKEKEWVKKAEEMYRAKKEEQVKRLIFDDVIKVFQKRKPYLFHHPKARKISKNAYNSQRVTSFFSKSSDIASEEAAMSIKSREEALRQRNMLEIEGCKELVNIADKMKEVSLMCEQCVFLTEEPQVNYNDCRCIGCSAYQTRNYLTGRKNIIIKKLNKNISEW